VTNFSWHAKYVHTTFDRSSFLNENNMPVSWQNDPETRVNMLSGLHKDLNKLKVNSNVELTVVWPYQHETLYREMKNADHWLTNSL
jgi:hypothetical protein